jgi:tRNA-binding protein
MTTVSWEAFQAVELRVGTILRVEDFPEARKPAYKVWVDFGSEIGEKCSSVQITALYGKEELIGKQVVCVTNFPPKRIAGFPSEVLVTGFYRENGDVVLAVPDKPAPNGAKLG